MDAKSFTRPAPGALAVLPGARDRHGQQHARVELAGGVDAADQIVVVSTIREDTAQSAAWALDALRSTGHDEAVRRAVTVLSAPEPKVDKDLQKRLRTHFGALTRAVIDVPHDKALVAGGPIDYEP